MFLITVQKTIKTSSLNIRFYDRAKILQSKRFYLNVFKIKEKSQLWHILVNSSDVSELSSAQLGFSLS